MVWTRGQRTLPSQTGQVPVGLHHPDVDPLPADLHDHRVRVWRLAGLHPMADR
jgi:hypothetical protein